MARAGRKRKLVDRYPSGRTVQPKPDQIKAVVRAQRVKLGATPANADNGEWESAAGRAYMHKLISRRQYDAAQAYERVIIRYAVANNIPAPFPRSPEFDADLRGGSFNAHDADDVASINAAYQRAFTALQDAGRQASLQVHALVKDGLNCYALPVIAMDNLHRGLDTLAEHFKIPRNVSQGLDAA